MHTCTRLTVQNSVLVFLKKRPYSWIVCADTIMRTSAKYSLRGAVPPGCRPGCSKPLGHSTGAPLTPGLLSAKLARTTLYNDKRPGPAQF